MISRPCHSSFFDEPEDEPSGGHREIGAARAGLKGKDVGAKQTLEHLAAPGQFGEQLYRGKRDVEIEADAMHFGLFSKHLWHELELIVLDPGNVVGPDVLGRQVGEPLIYRFIGAPPMPVKLRGSHRIVIERPQGAVAEAYIELLVLLLGQRYRDLVDVGVDK